MCVPMHSSCVQWRWWESWVWESTSHIIPQSVLAATTLVRGQDADGGTRSRARYELELLLCSVAVTALIWSGLPDLSR